MELNSSFDKITAAGRYYTDLSRVIGSYASLVVAMDSFAQEVLDVGHGLEAAAALGVAVPSDGDDPSWAAVYPVQFISRLEEVFEGGDLRARYNDIAHYAMAYEVRQHLRCSNYRGCGAQNKSCDEQVCLRLLLDDALMHEVNEQTEFSSVDYMVDPQRTASIALLKARVAIDNEVAPRMKGREMIERYRTRYAKTFGPLLPSEDSSNPSLPNRKTPV